MTFKLYVPGDSAALSVGAEKVAREIALEAERRGADVTIVRNGSRGLFWLEPLVEVECTEGRLAYGPIETGEVAALFDAPPPERAESIERTESGERTEPAPNLVGFVSLEPVQRKLVFLGIDRDGADPELGGGPEDANGDLRPVGDQQPSNACRHRPLPFSCSQEPAAMRSGCGSGIIRWA